MGKYINIDATGKELPHYGKAEAILKSFTGSQIIKEPETFTLDTICVVDNFIFDAAIWIHDENEFNHIKRTSLYDNRPLTWIHLPNAGKYAQ